MKKIFRPRAAARLALAWLLAAAAATVPNAGRAQDDADASAQPAPTSSEEQPAAKTEPERVSVRHILISNSKENAKEFAEDLVAQLRQNPKLFGQFVRKHTDDKKEGGGAYTEFPRGVMVGPFEDAAFAAEIGEITEPIETQFGYHIIQRLDPAPLRLIVVAYGDLAASLGMSRDRAQARDIATEVANLLRDGEPFGQVAGFYSDAAHKAIGGYYGRQGYRKGTSYGPALPDVLMEAIVDMERGEWRGPLWTDDAAIFVYAMENAAADQYEAYLDQTARLNMLFIAANPGEEGGLTREEAQAKANEASEKIAAGQDFDELAAQLSGYEGAKEPGASAVTLARRYMPPTLDQQAFSLPKGGTAVIELPQGFGVIQRLDEGPAMPVPAETQQAQARAVATKMLPAPSDSGADSEGVVSPKEDAAARKQAALEAKLAREKAALEAKAKAAAKAAAEAKAKEEAAAKEAAAPAAEAAPAEEAAPAAEEAAPEAPASEPAGEEKAAE